MAKRKAAVSGIPPSQAKPPRNDVPDVEPDAAPADDRMSGCLLPKGTYRLFKWLTLTALPALAVLVGSIGPVWSLPHTNAIVTTICAVALFLGSLVGVNEAKSDSPPSAIG